MNERTFLARQISPGSSSFFFRFPPAPMGWEGQDEKVRSTSHTEMSTSFPANANVVDDGPLDESANSGNGTERSHAESERDEEEE